MVAQMQWVSTGYGGAPGYTSFYSSTEDATALQSTLAAQRAFFDGIKGYLPNGVTYAPPTSYRYLDSTTGNLNGIEPVATPLTSVTGTGGTTFAAPAGFTVNWLTTTPATSRLVVGRTYIVPASTALYQADGTLVDAAKTALSSAANTLVTATTPIFVVWRRPVDHAGGSVALIVAARINDRVSVLRSRRS